VAIGVWHAAGGARRIACIAGDGRLMMNLQELPSIVGAAFGVPVSRVAAREAIGAEIQKVLDQDGASLREVMLDKAPPFAPRLSVRRLVDGGMVTSAIEHQAAFPRDAELADNLLIGSAVG